VVSLAVAVELASIGAGHLRWWERRRARKLGRALDALRAMAPSALTFDGGAGRVVRTRLRILARAKNRPLAPTGTTTACFATAARCR
jgi:hypothetical protein